MNTKFKAWLRSAAAFSLARLVIYYCGGSLPLWVPEDYRTEAALAGAFLVLLVWAEKRFRLWARGQASGQRSALHGQPEAYGVGVTLAGAWRWLNADGFTQSPPVGSKRHWLFFWVRIQLYDFRMTAGLPLTLLDPDGNRYRTDQTVRRSDEGSVPLFTSYLGIAKDTFVRAFTFHDFGFKKHGLWFCGAGSTVWAWLPMTRTALNEILAHGAEAEDGTAFQVGAVSLGVRLGSWFCWSRKAEQPEVMAQ